LGRGKDRAKIRERDGREESTFAVPVRESIPEAMEKATANRRKKKRPELAWGE